MTPLIAALRIGLVVAWSRPPESAGGLPEGRRFAGGGLGRARIVALVHFAQQFLRHEATLFDGQFSRLDHGALAVPADLCAVLEPEHIAGRRSNLA